MEDVFCRQNPANNIANQRYLAEEFLANCADAKVKPSWWKELIAKIRAWLRERFPSLQFTQQDIEGVLSMAARRVRKNSVVKENLTTDGDGVSEMENTRDGMRFAVIGEYGASRREWLENYYEEEIRSAQADERLESDLAQKDASRDAFDAIEEKISAALDEYDLTIDRAKTNAAGDSFYISFDDNEGESYTLRFSNHQQPARGSYRTSNFSETSGIGGSRSVTDVSVVLTDGAFDLTPAMEFIRKVAGVSDLSDGSDNKVKKKQILFNSSGGLLTAKLWMRTVSRWWFTTEQIGICFPKLPEKLSLMTNIAALEAEITVFSDADSILLSAMVRQAKAKPDSMAEMYISSI